MHSPLHKKRPILVRMIKSLSVIGTVTLIISVLNKLLQAVQLGDILDHLYHLTALYNADAPLNSEPLKCAKPSKRLSS